MNIDKKLVNEALQNALTNSVWKKDGKPDKVRKFDEAVDIIINIRDLDIKNPNNRIEQEFILPHPVTEKVKVCFFADGDMELALKKRGLPVINNDMLDDLQKKSNKDKRSIARKYDYFVARIDLMRNVAKVMARFLGQRGKMPKPQPKGYGVISTNENLDQYVNNLKSLIKVEMKKQLQIQLHIGKKSNSMKDLEENLDALLGLIESKLPNGYQNLRSIFIKTTMGKPVKVREPATKGR
jgi:large subunit ribosomal protein L1